MSALDRIRAAGFSVDVEMCRLKITPSNRLNRAQREFIEKNRLEIMDALDAEKKELLVTCWTPSGAAMQVQAKNKEHAEFLRRMNPQPGANNE